AAEGASSSATATEKPKSKPKPGVFDMVPSSEGGIAPDDTPALSGPQGAQPGQPAGIDPGVDLEQGLQQGAYPVDEAGRDRP
ncbi:SPFH/Band 7/PHB domain protein, partial [Dietzia sp. B44]|nr:SPFH/Band 7/PHB domain protein [Dietzia sp. B44]